MLNTNILTEQSLRRLKECAYKILAVKRYARIYIQVSTGIYIVKVRDREDYWTFNESQAIEVYNAAPNDRLQYVANSKLR